VVDTYTLDELDQFAAIVRGFATGGCCDVYADLDAPLIEAPAALQVAGLVSPTGGTFWDPYYDRLVTWRPAGPIVDFDRFVDERAEFSLLGILGDNSHWNKPYAGDHTSRSTHSVLINGVRTYPAAGWVYAIDIGAADAILAALRDWLLAELHAGRAGEIKYFNVLGLHYHRDAGWVPTSSGDHHLHISIMPGWETKRSTLLADFWAHHTGQTPEEDDMTPEQAKQLAELHALSTEGKRIAGPTQTTEGGKPVLWLARQFWEQAKQLAALTSAVSTLAQTNGQDPAAVLAAVERGAQTAVAEALVHGATDPTPDTP